MTEAGILQDSGNVHFDSMFEFETGVILNVNKPESWSSFDVVKKIRNIIHIKKVGHAGTLDPFATGVLLVCTGKATKRVPELVELDKEYEAKIELGKNTDTFDRTGKVVGENEITHVTLKKIQEALGAFRGEISQIPPMYSAIKVDGQRLYKLARKGVTVERKARPVTIYELELLGFDSPFLSVRVCCSKGTYIRSLAYDIGQVLNTGAHLAELVRTRIGPYRVEDAVELSRFAQTYKH